MKDSWRPKIVGHRGARNLAPENTMPGFKLAAEMNLASAELDVHLTADGHVVVIHDHTVDRTTNGSGRVDELTLEEIRELDAAASWNGAFPHTSIPTLDEVMTEYGKRFDWEIELKVDDRTDVPALIHRSAEIIERHGATENAILTSFCVNTVEQARNLRPDFRRGLITSENPLGLLDLAVELGCIMFAVHQAALDAQVGAAIRECGLWLSGWQGNSAEELTRLHDARVDGFSSDRPDIALEWLRDKGVEPMLRG